MKIINLSEQNSILGQYLLEMRDENYQVHRLSFLNNMERIGRLEAYEISKTLEYKAVEVKTPLGRKKENIHKEDIVLAPILRAGIALHRGFMDVFEKADNAFVSAYREYTDEQHHEVAIHVEYLATPDITDRTLILIDPMLATGGSMELAYKALTSKGTPKKVHIACVLAVPEGIEAIKRCMPEDTTLWCADIDEGLNENKYIVPGFGDAGDLCFGEKL